MRRILNFFLGNTVRLLFWFYILIALGLSAQNQMYFSAVYLHSSNRITGSTHAFFNGINRYFSLQSENDFLQQQNRALQQQLAQLPHAPDSLYKTKKNFSYISGEIIKNSFTAKDNYLTLSLGIEDSVSPDMGVVNEKGIIGIITHSGEKFSRVQSILNSQSRINAKIKGSDFFGGLVWDGKLPNVVQLIDVPNLAQISVGDTIVSGGMSAIFPDQLPIGTIKSFELTQAKDYYLISVRLFNDMQNIGRVYVIENQQRTAIKDIENQNNE